MRYYASGALMSQDETYRDQGSEWLLQILTSVRGACLPPRGPIDRSAEARPPQRLNHWQVFVRNATWIESVLCELDAPWGSSGRLIGSLSVPWMWDIEPPELRGKTNSGAAAYLLCPIPSEWIERMWLNAPGPPDTLPGTVTARISLRLRDTLLPYKLPPYKLRPRPALPKQTVGGACAPVGWTDTPSLQRVLCL